MELIDTTKRELLESKGRLFQLFETTPDDKLNWRPSPNSRSILEIGAHIGWSLGCITEQMQGTPYTVPQSALADASFREHDRQFTTRAQVTDYLTKQFQVYSDFLDSLSDSDLDRMTKMPFGLGEIPLRHFLGAGERHTFGHIGQIEYIQTMYGDFDWHFGF